MGGGAGMADGARQERARLTEPEGLVPSPLEEVAVSAGPAQSNRTHPGVGDPTGIRTLVLTVKG